MESLQDRGWGQMSTLLDAEMPVKRKRRGFLLWLLLPLMMATAAGAWLMLEGQNEEVAPPAKTDSQELSVPVPVMTATAFAPIDDEKDAESQATEVVDVNVSADVSVTEATVAKPVSVIAETLSDERETANPVLLASAQSELRSISKDLNIIRDEEIAQGSQISKSAQGNTAGRDESAIDQEPSPNLVANAIADRDNEEVRVITPVPQRSMTYAQASVPMITPASSKVGGGFGFDLFGAAHVATPQAGFRGIEAGLLANFGLSRRLRLNVGFSYSHNNDDGLLKVGGFSQDELAVLDPGVTQDTTSYPGGQILNYQLLNYDTALLISEKFNYLHMPVILEYRVGRNVNVVGGFKVSRLISAPPIEATRDILFRPGFNNSGTADAEVVKTALIDEGVVRRWDIAPLVGVSVDMGRRFAFDIQYQFGLIPYIDRPAANRQDYNRSLSLGLRYRVL